MTKREILIYNLRNLILIITENGKKIEELKTSLYTNKLFDYSTLCRRIDMNKNGIITKIDFEKFLMSHTVNAPHTIIDVLFNYYGDGHSGNEKYFSYEGFNYFLYPKNYISSRITSIYSKNNISFDLEEKVCNIIMHEFALINEVTKALDNFYNDNNFTIYDIITFFYNGKENTFINDLLLEKFCIKYNIPITHNEMRLLLFYLKADSQNIITYNTLKTFFIIFVLDKTSVDTERNNKFFINTLSNYTYLSLDKINNNKMNQKNEIQLIDFIKEFLRLEYLLYVARKNLYSCSDFIPIELKVDVEVLKARCQTEYRKWRKKISNPQKLERVVKEAFSKSPHFEHENKIVIDSSSLSEDETFELIKNHLNKFEQKD
jgi:hypothetical protein